MCGIFCLIYSHCEASNGKMIPPVGAPTDTGFEPYSPYYGPDCGPGPPMGPPYPDFGDPGFMPAYVQPNYPPPCPPYLGYSQPPDNQVYTSRNYAPRERPNETAGLQMRSQECSENVKGRSDAGASSKQANKIRKVKGQKKNKKATK
ncbi:hypothetical protein OESDEN_06317 [Oesophagostomum dentatum]|uniref:Uncharacterized protein n=1 Tax=Oesophagostomum dentatum TaxID=61180 RepID=A0A0B1T887_OESDE|nr:hypothetical protein OESDEN_06317 [Oesophagostomum dentatum]